MAPSDLGSDALDRLARWRSWLSRVSRLDAATSVLGVLFGIASLGYPFGRDQGLYYYIGREWLQHGSLPYRDSFDVKTPGIYLLHAIAIAVFGERQWGIRVLDLSSVCVLGCIAGSLAARRGGAPSPGARGLAVLGASVVYYGFFDYWNTGQCELYCVTLSMGAFWLTSRGTLTARRALVAGLLAGMAVMFKPPAICFAPLTLLAIGVRSASWRDRATRIALYGVGAASVVGLIVLYFAVRGGLPALYDVLVVNNRHYVKQGAWVHSTAEVLQRTRDAYHFFDPMITVLLHSLLVGVGVGLYRRDKDMVLRHLLPIALAVLTFCAVLMQFKFVWYHWGILTAAGATAIAVLAEDLIAWFESQRASRAARVAVGGAALYVFALFWMTGRAFDRWSGEVSIAADYVTGRVDRAAYLRSFSYGPPMPYSYADTEMIALWVRDHSSATDQICVRGFEPQIYTVAQRRCPSRFFWTTFLVRPEWAYDMNRWLEEDRQVLLRTPPRYILALNWVHEGVDSAEYYESLGYVRRENIFAYTILEHREVTAAP